MSEIFILDVQSETRVHKVCEFVSLDLCLIQQHRSFFLTFRFILPCERSQQLQEDGEDDLQMFLFYFL